MDEIWQEIPNSDYSVSSLGRVASRKYGKLRILKPGPNSKGYLRLDLFDGRGGKKNIKVHILVAEAFLGPRPTPKHQVNHKDGIRTNPRVENLEWVTASQNARHCLDVLGHKPARGEKVSTAKLTEANVREIRRRCAAGESWRVIASAYRVSQRAIAKIAHGKSWAWLK